MWMTIWDLKCLISAGNLGNLPIILVPAVCKQSGSPFGDVNVCYKNALAYASLSMAVWH